MISVGEIGGNLENLLRQTLLISILGEMSERCQTYVRESAAGLCLGTRSSARSPSIPSSSALEHRETCSTFRSKNQSAQKMLGTSVSCTAFTV